MSKRITGKVVWGLAGAFLFLGGWVLGQQQAKLQETVMHAVAFTPTAQFDDQKMAEFKKATETLAHTVPGVRRAWVGKLRRPLTVGDATRTHGLIFEFDDLASREGYSSHPNRVPWAEVWEQVRMPGATVYDVLGE